MRDAGGSGATLPASATESPTRIPQHEAVPSPGGRILDFDPPSEPVRDPVAAPRRKRATRPGSGAAALDRPAPQELVDEINARHERADDVGLLGTEAEIDAMSTTLLELQPGRGPRPSSGGSAVS
jgi:hypothetical protein